MSREGRALAEADPARAIAKMLSKLDDADKDTLNMLLAWWEAKGARDVDTSGR